MSGAGEMMGVELPAELIHMAFQDLEEGLIHCDLDGRITAMDRLAEKILELRAVDLAEAGGHVGETGILRREDLEPVASGLKILNAPAVIRRNGERSRRILISAFPLTGEDGEVTGMLLALKPAPPVDPSSGIWKQWSAAILEQVSHDLQEGVGFVDLEGRFHFCSRALCDIVGLEPEMLLNRLLPSCIKPLGRPLLFLEALETTVKQGSWESDMEIEAGGFKKNVHATTKLVKDDMGQEAGISLVVKDVTDSVRYEGEVEEARHELSIIHGMLGNATDYYDMAGTMAGTLNDILRALRSEAGAVFMWDRELGGLRLHAGSGLTYRGSVRLEKEAGQGGALFQVFQENRPWLVHDTSALPIALEITGKRGRLRSLLAAPVRSGLASLGVIVVGHKQAEAFTQRQVETLLSMVSRVGLVFELARTFNSLQEKVEELGAARDLNRLLLTRLPGMVFQTDGEGRVIDVNRLAVDLLGTGEDDLIGRPFARIIRARDRGDWRQLAGETGAGESFQLDACLLDEGKSELAVKLTCYATGSPPDSWEGLLIVATPFPKGSKRAPSVS